MDDGSTRKIQRRGGKGAVKELLDTVRATLIQVSGEAAGTEYELKTDRVTLGRGPNADITFDDTAMSREHAALELAEEGFQLVDLGSTNGVLVNGVSVSVADLKHGDRFQLGDHIFQYVLEERERSPREFEVP
ncbi:MAG: FHA domain-containing protein [Myxococcota bacterium]